MNEPAESADPPTRLVRRYAVRRDDDDLEQFIDELVMLVNQGTGLIDISRYDRRGNVIELRVAAAHPRGDES